MNALLAAIDQDLKAGLIKLPAGRLSWGSLVHLWQVLKAIFFLVLLCPALGVSFTLKSQGIQIYFELGGCLLVEFGYANKVKNGTN